jgi:hypothetical protein
MRLLLNAVNDGETHASSEAFEKVCKYFNLTEQKLSEKQPSEKQTIICNQVLCLVPA